MTQQTVRERIVQQFMRVIRSMNPEDGDVTKWDQVIRHSLEEVSEGKYLNALIGVFDTREDYNYAANSCTECSLRVQVEYWYKVAVGLDPATEMERLRGNLVQVLTRADQLVEDGTEARLTHMIRLVTSDRDVTGPREGYGGAYIEFLVMYRHRTGDPHRLMSE